MSHFKDYTDERLKNRIAEVTVLLEMFFRESDAIIETLPEEEKNTLLNEPNIKDQYTFIQQVTTLLAQLECELFERNHR